MSAPRSRTATAAVALLAIATGCATPRQKDYTRFLAAQPRSILVVPVVNDTVAVEAPDYFLSTVPIPLADRGYYVFPVNLVKRLLEDDGLSDANLVHQADPAKLGALFGADAILYVTIHKWQAQWILVSTTVTVAFEYVLKDAKTGTELWRHAAVMQYASDSGGGGLIGAIVGAAITRAAPNYMPLARQANELTLRYPGPGFPAGPYRPEYGKDLPKAPPPEAAPAATAQLAQ